MYNATGAAGIALGNYTIAKAPAPSPVDNNIIVSYGNTAPRTHSLTGLPTDMGTFACTQGAVTDTHSILQSSSVVKRDRTGALSACDRPYRCRFRQKGHDSG